MNGRWAVLLLLGSVFAGGAALWILQSEAGYREFEGAQHGFGPLLMLPGGDREFRVSNIRGIKGDSSPLKFRACFLTDPGNVNEKIGEAYPDASPLIAPKWFECFDAAAIGSDIESGDARAVLLRRNIAEGVDRVAAFYRDGRGFAWQQLSQN